MLNPDIPTQELRLHMGELTAQEVLVARAAIRWANSSMLDKGTVEKVACAIFTARNGKWDYDRYRTMAEPYRQDAKAAIAAMEE